MVPVNTECPVPGQETDTSPIYSAVCRWRVTLRLSADRLECASSADPANPAPQMIMIAFAMKK